MNIENTVTLIGTVEEVSTDIRSDKSGKEFIAGKVVVNCGEYEGKKNLIDVRVFAYRFTKSGSESKLYQSYVALDSYLNKRVRITASLREDSMFSQSRGKMTYYNAIYLRFINDAKSVEEDGATFVFSGFVVRELYARTNADGETLGYRIEVAQPTFDGAKNIYKLLFDVPREAGDIVAAIEDRYKAGLTVEFSGRIYFTSTIEKRTESAAFGEDTVKTYVNSEKRYYITSGKEPLDDDNPEAYTEAQIKDYITTYKAACADKEEKAKNNTSGESNPVAKAMASATRASSLI